MAITLIRDTSKEASLRLGFKTSLSTVPAADESGSPYTTLQFRVHDGTLNQEVTAADLANGSLRFVPAADESGSPYTTLQFRVHDGTDYSVANYTLTVNVTPVNDPPVNTVPGQQTLFDYQSLTFSAVNGNAISVDDVDQNITTVQLTTVAGTLAVTANGSAVVNCTVVIF